jgi:hypothetical protein
MDDPRLLKETFSMRLKYVTGVRLVRGGQKKKIKRGIRRRKNAREMGRGRRHLVRAEVLTAMTMKMAAFWVVAPCRLVEEYRRFGDRSP